MYVSILHKLFLLLAMIAHIWPFQITKPILLQLLSKVAVTAYNTVSLKSLRYELVLKLEI
jgi:hypothetical protein